MGVFRPNSGFISKTVEHTAIVTTEDEMVPFPITLSDPNLDFKVTIV